MNQKTRILVADDDESHRKALEAVLKDWSYEPILVKNGLEALNYLKKNENFPPDLVMLDVRMPEMDGLTALQEMRHLNPNLAALMMTAFDDVNAAVEAIKSGVFDYLTKPLDFSRLKITLRNCLAQQNLQKSNNVLAEALREQESKPLLLGNSPSMQSVKNLIDTLAPTEANVLIFGESGTGKEVVARMLHQKSARVGGPFIAINCGAFTETLLASELFGHEKGAFTGADKKHEGLFMEASGGSIFLDEIGEMPLSMQVKLLRVLQEKEVLSVGGKTPKPLNCRIIAATNRNLEEEVKKGEFREDLFYRLNVVNIKMPGLREHPEDIPVYAQKFAQKFAAANHKNFSGISRAVLNRLQNYNWPGNVRELENVMERAVIFMPGDFINLSELPERLLEETEKPSPQSGNSNPAQILSSSAFFVDNMTLEEVERRVILKTLEETGNNKTEAAKRLGITRKTLHAKLNRYASS